MSNLSMKEQNCLVMRKNKLVKELNTLLGELLVEGLDTSCDYHLREAVANHIALSLSDEHIAEYLE